jgi:predicted metal-dependent phosphoesterase TrpH
MDTQQIKDHMPETYKAIQEKAGKIGNLAYKLVRSSLKGEPNQFYAIERGHVAGTPFDMGNVPDEIARLALQFGISYLIMWGPEAQRVERENLAVEQFILDALADEPDPGQQQGGDRGAR